MKKILSIVLILALASLAMGVCLAEFEPIHKGDRGERVVEIQLMLKELGYLDGGVDGDFGGKTESAIIRFQKDNSLDATGIIGEATYNTMIAKTNASDNSSKNSTGGSTDKSVGSESKISPAEPIGAVTIKKSDCALVITDAGFAVSHGYLYYAVIIHNSSDKEAIEFPVIRITARNADGSLLGTGDQTLNVAYPGQDLQWAGMAYFEVSENPSKVEFEIVDPDDYNIVPVTRLSHPTYSPLEVSEVNKKGTRILGEVYNPNDYALDQIAIIAMFRDKNGSLLAGDTTFVDSIKPSGSVPFDMDISKSLVTDNYEVFAISWSF